MRYAIQYREGGSIPTLTLKKTQMTQRKKDMLKALEKSLGVVTTACKSVGIERKTHYRWLEKDSKYAEAVADIKNISLDFAESQLHKRMNDGSDTAIIFFLKTQGKSRGYVEKTELDIQGEIKLPQIKWKDE